MNLCATQRCGIPHGQQLSEEFTKSSRADLHLKCAEIASIRDKRYSAANKYSDEPCAYCEHTHPNDEHFIAAHVPLIVVVLLHFLIGESRTPDAVHVQLRTALGCTHLNVAN